MYLLHNVRFVAVGLLLVGCCCVDRVDFGLEFDGFVFGDGCDGGRVPRELDQVCRFVDARLVECLTTAEGLHEVVRLPTAAAPQVAVPAVVASDDAAYLPPSEPHEVGRRDAYLAHEQGVKLMGACQFFGFSSLLAVSAVSASSACLTTSGTSKNLPISSATTA